LKKLTAFLTVACIQIFTFSSTISLLEFISKGEIVCFISQNIFTFDVKLSNMAIKEDHTSGLLLLVNPKGETVAYFAKPFMIDANDNISDAVQLSVTTEDGATFLDVIADQEWLQSAAYPVMIDPTIISGEPKFEMHKDTFVSSALPNSTFTENTFLLSGTHSTYGRTRTYVQFELPGLASSANIQSATFSMYQTAANATSHTLDLHRVTSFWDAYATTWHSQPTTLTTAESSVTSSVQNAFWNLNVTNLVRAWYNNTLQNNGMMIRHRTETDAFRWFTSANASNQAQYPRLSITYTVDPIGVESFWGFTQSGVNGYNGNLVLQNTDVHIPGRGIPVTFSRTYNSRSLVDGFLGFGWSANVYARLRDSGYGPITFIDEDGTEHYFGRSANGSYTAPPGVFLNLVKNADNTYTVTQMDGTTIHFNTSGQMTSIVDTNNNTTTFNYTSGRLSGIIDASGRSTSFAYNASNRLWRITDHAGRTVTYGYDANGNLTSVTNQGGHQTTYEYDSARNLIRATDARGTRYYYHYTNDNRVKSVNFVNMLMNPSFEADADQNGLPDQWTLDSGAGGTASLDTAGNPPVGRRSFRINASTANPQFWSAYLSDPITVNRARTYTLSGHVRANLVSGSHNTVLSLFAYSATNTNLGEFARMTLSNTQPWQRISSTLAANTLPADTAYVRIRAAASSGGNGTSWFDAIQFEEGAMTGFANASAIFYNTATRRTIE
jgi:YD repeat-containing protein